MKQLIHTHTHTHTQERLGIDSSCSQLPTRLTNSQAFDKIKLLKAPDVANSSHGRKVLKLAARGK